MITNAAPGAAVLWVGLAAMPACTQRTVGGTAGGLSGDGDAGGHADTDGPDADSMSGGGSGDDDGGGPGPDADDGEDDGPQDDGPDDADGTADGPTADDAAGSEGDAADTGPDDTGPAQGEVQWEVDMPDVTMLDGAVDGPGNAYLVGRRWVQQVELGGSVGRYAVTGEKLWETYLDTPNTPLVSGSLAPSGPVVVRPGFSGNLAIEWFDFNSDDDLEGTAIHDLDTAVRPGAAVHPDGRLFVAAQHADGATWMYVTELDSPSPPLAVDLMVQGAPGKPAFGGGGVFVIVDDGEYQRLVQLTEAPDFHGWGILPQTRTIGDYVGEETGLAYAYRSTYAVAIAHLDADGDELFTTPLETPDGSFLPSGLERDGDQWLLAGLGVLDGLPYFARYSADGEAIWTLQVDADDDEGAPLVLHPGVDDAGSLLAIIPRTEPAIGCRVLKLAP